MIIKQIPIILLALSIFTFVLYSKDVKKISVLLVKDEKVLNKIISPEQASLTKKDSSYFCELPVDSNMVKYESSNKYTADKNNYLVFLFYDNKDERIQLKDIKRLHQTIFSASFDFDYESNYVLYDLKKLGNGPKNKSIITIEVSADTIKQRRFFQFRNNSELYSAFGNILGFWFPINMYSTNFQMTDNGVLFTAMPAGIAWGGKWNTSSDFYFGGSLTCNWTVANAKNKSKNSFFLQDISIGILIDFGGWFYLGYAHPVNLTSQEIKLDNQFIIGVGTDITNFFAGKK